MDDGGYDGAEKSERAQAHAYPVHNKRPNEVGHDDPMTAPGYMDGLDELQKIVTDQGDGCRFPCNVRPRTHGDAHVRLDQCRNVIDAVPEHRHLPAAAHHCSDSRQFLFRQEFGSNFVDPEGFSYDLGVDEVGAELLPE